MQYILTEEEYLQLKKDVEDAKAESKETINTLCISVADNLPITRWPGSEQDPQPWGCVVNKKHEWYCDDCPVKDICQMPKQFSK